MRSESRCRCGFSFKGWAPADGESGIPTWLTDKSLCDLSTAQIECGCTRHERKIDRVTSKSLSFITNSSVFPTSEELGQLVSHNIYGSVNEMFVLWPKNSRTAIFEEVGYLLHDLKSHAH